MRGYTFLSFFASLITGIFIARYSGPWCLVIVFLAAVSCVVARVLDRAIGRTVSLALSFLFLGALLMLSTSASVSRGVLTSAARNREVAIATGRVISSPTSREAQTTFFMQVREVSVGRTTWSTRERLYVSIEGRIDLDSVFQGVTVEVKGRLAAPEEGARWIFDRGAGSIIRSSGSSIRRLPVRPDPVSRAVAGARRGLSSIYKKLFDARIAGFMDGVTISKLDSMDKRTTDDLKACGLSHIVSVSGLHVASAAMLALAVAAALGLGKRPRYMAAALMAMGVLALANFQVPAMRSTLMAGACFGGAVAGRRYDPLVAISIVGIVLLCMNPRAAFDLSFQYSFAAALGIVVLAGRMRKKRSPGRLRTSLAVCAAAQLGTLPLVILRGEAVPVSAIVANLLVVWLVGLLVVLGVLVALVSFASLPLARVVALAPAAMSRYILAVASWCARVPGAGPYIGVLSAAALAAYIVSLVLLVRSVGGGSILKPVVALGTSFFLVMCSCYPILIVNSGTSMVVMDVGEGDASLLQDGGSGIVLVDGGPEPDLLVARLRSRGISRIDLMVATHPHADHVTGLVEVIRKVPVGRLIHPGVARDSTGAYRQLIDEARLRDVPDTVGVEGQVISAGNGIKLEVLYSPSTIARPPENLNNCSLVFMAYLGGSRVLFTGDLETDAQQTLVRSHPSIGCDILKVPHHGSANATGDSLLAAARPGLATISVGKGNKLGHPSARCLEALAKRGVGIARTDMMGDIVIRFRSGRIGLESRR
ncbi:MAG: ComEC/Rec2 family competence protein [Candidatus Geothermincolia bacterium]